MRKKQEKQEKPARRIFLTKALARLSTKRKLALVAALAVGVFAFIAIVLSPLGAVPKALVAISELIVFGVVLQRLLGVEGAYGFLILRLAKSFALIEKLVQGRREIFAKLFDFGFSIGFGVVFAALRWHTQPKRLFAAFLASTALSLFLTIGMPVMKEGAFLAGSLFGLFGIGMLSLSVHAASVLTLPEAPPGVYLLIPGITPGIPLIEGILAIIVIASIHELAHAIACRAEKIALKSSGILLFGFIPIGAFVEPHEESLRRAALEKKRGILVAGSTANILGFFIFLALAQPVALVLFTLVDGVEVTNVFSGTPAQGVLQVGDVIFEGDGEGIRNVQDFANLLKTKAPNQTLSIVFRRGDERRVATLSLDPRGRVGIAAQEAPKPDARNAFEVVSFLYRFLRLTFFLNLALAVVNLLPIFISDGHRLLKEELSVCLRDEKAASRITAVLGVVTLALIAINLFPWLR